MKKLVILTLVLSFLLTVVPAFAQDSVTVELDGVVIDCRDANGNVVSPLLIDGTTYLPVRAVATALNLQIEWDDATKSVFINGTPDKAELTDVINIYIAGAKFTPKDADGKTVNPILENNTTYLPIRAIGKAFDKKVGWDNETKTAILTSPSFVSFDESKTYAIVSKATGKAVSVTDAGLVTEKFNSYDYQGFKFTPSAAEGYYHIQSIVNSKNFDVNGNSKSPGGTIITYNAGTAENQMFAVEKVDDGYIIYARSSHLPIEDSAGKIKQNTLRDSIVQRWDIVEFTPVEKTDETKYYLMFYGTKLLYDSPDGVSLKSELANFNDYDHSRPDSPFWTLTPNEDGEYIITNLATGKSLDVANNSQTSGDPVITYQTSGDANQRWILENQERQTYLIKSVHSDLYLSFRFDNLVQWVMMDDPASHYWAIYPAN